ncbi:hypothetical protein [Aureimonas frigidaquae]|uniref:hypothetical protein n=1 Tax=Aureimonas frigidaquae TaxID=424757 RepID=UPI000783512D|nr:hypothetical protein [Aureimonas frigidaquae]
MSQLGEDLIEAVKEMAADLRGEVRAESYEIPVDAMTLERTGNERAVKPALSEGEFRLRPSRRRAFQR